MKRETPVLLRLVALEFSRRCIYRVAVLGFCLLLALKMSGQESASSSGSTIRGTVINKVTGEPIFRALVYTDDNRFATLTDSEGHFEFRLPELKAHTPDSPDVSVFRGLRRSVSYLSVQVRKPGFMQDSNVFVTALQSDEESIIALLPEAIIQGRVFTAEREPAARTPVQLFSRQVQNGILRWQPLSMTMTNSNGEYRFAELLPGEYKVMTNEQMDNDPEDLAPGGQAYGYPPSVFPGVNDFASGSTIALTPGQTVQADIPVTRQPYFQISLPVLSSAEVPGMNISVQAQSNPGPGYSLGYNPGTHKVEGLLPNGNYQVEATSFGPGGGNGRTIIHVAGAALKGPALAITPSSPIVVDLREQFSSSDNWQGSFSWSDGQRVHQVRGPRSYLQISLEPADGFSARGVSSLRMPRSEADTALVIENTPPGKYWVTATSSRGYVQSLTSDGVDLLHQPLVVTAGSHAPIEVVLRDGTGQVEGKVAEVSRVAASSNEPPSSSDPVSHRTTPAAFIYFVPVSDDSGVFAQVFSDNEGAFSTGPIPPGTYRVLAFTHPHRNLPFRDAEAMRAYETQGQIVHVPSGETERVQLHLSEMD